MRKYFATLGLLSLLLGSLTAPPAYAQDAQDSLDITCETATGAPCKGGPPLEQTIGVIINGLLVLLGFIFLYLMIEGGISWMTAGGNEEKVAKAKVTINAAIAGLIVVFISYALADAIVDVLSSASGTGP